MVDVSGSSTFGELLRRYRLAAGLSQEQLAERTGLSVRGVSDLERGVRRTPRLDTVRMLADGLELDPDAHAALLRAARPSPDAGWHQAGASRIPVPPTPLIGREQELAGIGAALRDPETRLATLTGPGGVGKTRLALEAAATITAFPDGIYFVELAPIRDPSQVDSAVATALGVRETAGIPLRAAIVHALREKRLLLVLDNFEHLLPAASLVAALIAGSAGVTVLVTSRVPLGLRGERQVPIPPLALPETNGSSSIGAESAAVRLFVARVRDAVPSFELDPDNAGAVTDICRRLDGLPLALELAAVRVKVLPPAALLARLDRTLPLLHGGPTDLPSRQRTLRGTIAWSHDLLGPDERALFRCLSIFAGGWSLAAVDAVAAPDTEIDVLDTMSTLVNQSLVTAIETPNGDVRYTMLETVREFAFEQLQQSGHEVQVRERHARWCLELARAGAVNLADAQHGGWLTTLEAEQANIRVALAWLRDHGPAEDGLRLATALGGFWRLRSASAEGHGWMNAFLERADTTALSADERAAALHWAGELAGLVGDMAEAESRLAESLALARETGNVHGIILALAALGSVTVQQGNTADAVPLFVEGAALAREAGDQRQGAFLTAYLAVSHAGLGDLDRADALATESEALLRSLGDVRSFEMGFAAMVQGWLAIAHDDVDRATERFGATIALAHELDAKGILSATHPGLAEIALIHGQVDVALAHFREGYAMGIDGAFQSGLAFNLQGLVRIAADRDAVRGARLVGALEACAGAVRAMPPVVVDRYETALARLRATLDNRTFNAQAAIGRSLPPDAIVGEAKALEATAPGS